MSILTHVPPNYCARERAHEQLPAYAGIDRVVPSGPRPTRTKPLLRKATRVRTSETSADLSGRIASIHPSDMSG